MQTATKRMMNRVSLSQLTMDPISVSELVTVAAGAGFDSVGLRLAPAPGAKVDPRNHLSPADVREVRQRLADTGVSALIATSFWLLPESGPGNEEALLDAAVELGVEHYLVVCNDRDEARALANFVRLCRLAASRDIKIALEFMAYTALPSLAGACAFLGAAAQDNAGIVIDALHLARSGGTPADLAAVAPGLILVAQLCDAPLTSPPLEELRVEARTRRLYPGQGELWLAELMDALPAGVAIDVEAPCAHAVADPQARALEVAGATFGFLERYRGRRRQELPKAGRPKPP
jgi:sugar phosphate isomerase/epimerase